EAGEESEGPGHPLAAAPVTVGAAQDGIALSEDASMALRHSLPDFQFHPDEPMADAVIDTPPPPQTQEAAAAATTRADRGQENGGEGDGNGTADADPTGPNGQRADLPASLGREHGRAAQGHGRAVQGHTPGAQGHPPGRSTNAAG